MQNGVAIHTMNRTLQYMKIARTYRLNIATDGLIKSFAAELDVSEATVIERAVACFGAGSVGLAAPASIAPPVRNYDPFAPERITRLPRRTGAPILRPGEK